VGRCGGVDRALPKAIMKDMDVGGLTRENVASHLQKHRMRLKREGSDEAGASPHAAGADGIGAQEVQHLGGVQEEERERERR